MRDLLDSVELDPATGCHEWRGQRTLGYGVVELPGTRAAGARKVAHAHRLMWEMLHGFTDAEHIHHLCENKGCVRPSHLTPVSLRTNVRLAYSTFQDGTCRRGHSDIRRKPSGGHYCRTCNTDRMRRARNGDQASPND